VELQRYLVSVGEMVIKNPWGDFPGRVGNSPFLKVSFSVQSFIGFETRKEEQKQEDEKEEEKVRKDKEDPDEAARREKEEVGDGDVEENQDNDEDEDEDGDSGDYEHPGFEWTSEEVLEEMRNEKHRKQVNKLSASILLSG